MLRHPNHAGEPAGNDVWDVDVEQFSEPTAAASDAPVNQRSRADVTGDRAIGVDDELDGDAVCDGLGQHTDRDAVPGAQQVATRVKRGRHQGRLSEYLVGAEQEKYGQGAHE